MSILGRFRRDALPRSAGFRGDIQGLRAVAVIAVVVNHLFHWPRGGFVGVDIFFVISGFLITGLLVREHERTGKLSLVRFYLRRVRRLMPAALLTLIVVAVVASALFSTGRADSVRLDAIASLLLVANWRFGIIGTDYFAWGNAVSPLEHFWSLSVEEQFYLVWPSLIIAAFFFGRRAPRKTAFVALGAITAGSFGWAVVESAAEPSFAYFSTLTRVWELGVGALLAMAVPWIPRLPDLTRTVLAYLGIAGILASLFVVSPDAGFPGPWAALPVLSTAVVIGAGTGGEAPKVWPLTNPVSRYIGDISYSIYLWHMPLIVFVGVFLADGTWAHAVVTLAATAVLSVFSYHAVEHPMTTSPLFSRYSSPSERRMAFGRWRHRTSREARFGVMLLVTSILAGLIGFLAIPTQTTPVAAEPVPTAKATTSQQRLVQQVSSALTATGWPELTPSAGQAATAGAPEEDGAGCGNTDLSDPASCAFGDRAKPALVVFGDSTGITLLPTVRTTYRKDYFVRGLTIAACPIIDLNVVFDTAQRRRDCLEHRRDSVAVIKKLRPQVVFITNNYQWLLQRKLASGATGDAAQREWAAAARSTVQKISPYTDHIVFVTPPPEGPVIGDCATRISVPDDCRYTVPDTWQRGHAAVQSIVGGKVSMINTLDWFCVDGLCPIFVGHTPVKRDNIHTTKQYAKIIAPSFAAKMQPIVDLGRK